MRSSTGTMALAWGRLLRLPNVFTAQADVLVGLIAGGVLANSPMAAGAILLCSSSLYFGGIVLNDVMDLDEDRRDRPQRPLPRGEISIGRAAATAFGLLAIGVLMGLFSGFLVNRSAPAVVAIALTGSILVYNCLAKRSYFGPLLLGVCRFLNVLLGWSPILLLTPAAPAWYVFSTPVLTAAVTGSYVFTLSWIARYETVGLERLAARLWIFLLTVPLVLIQFLASRGTGPWLDTTRWFGFVLFGLLLIACTRVALRVWQNADAGSIGRTVGELLALILLVDATMLGVLGHGWAALSVLGLYIPLRFLRRWMYMT